MSKSTTKVESTVAELVAAFPDVFSLDPALVRPVKLGIKDDLYGQSAISHQRITAALRAYCNSAHYLEACTERTVRINLAGEPTGPVTATEAHHAREGLAALAKVAAKQASKIANAASAPKAARTPNGAGTGKSSPRAAPAAPMASDTIISPAKVPGS